MQQEDLSRRDFIHGTARAGLAAAAAPLVSNRILGANDRIVMAIIGAGGMGRGHMRYFQKEGCEWAAVCDVYEPNRLEGLKIAGPQAKGYNDYREVLERKDIDAVLIATPEHWHHRHLIDTVRAGKDAYCEKPMSWSIEQGAEMVKEVRKTDRTVQIGMQRRSAPVIIEIKKLIDEGTIGEINLVRAEWWWNLGPVNRQVKVEADRLDWKRFVGPAPHKHEFDPVKYRYWRYFWDFSGGNMTDQGTHLIDVVQWCMNVDRPLSALSYGSVYKLQPAETPDTFCAIVEYPKFTATWTLTYTNSFQKGWALIFQGQKGTIELSEEGYKVYPEPWNEKKNYCRWEVPAGVKENLPGNVTNKDPHVKNFLECVKSRRQPNATVEIGHQAVRTLHLANIAHHKKTRAALAPDGVTVRT
jgi:predicted dehydrogenase